jgi:xanthine dehydrogenase molybdopterin-binding subunit B
MANTPREFNTRLLSSSVNSRRKAVYSSKGVGEVATFLGSAAFFALRNAVHAARQDAGCKADFELGTPATV